MRPCKDITPNIPVNVKVAESQEEYQTLGEFIEERDAISVMDRIADKIKRFRENAFIIIPEDHTALQREREAFYAKL